MGSYPDFCTECNIGQLHLIAPGRDFSILKCHMCDTVFKYERGLLFITTKGYTYTVPNKTDKSLSISSKNRKH